MEEVERVEQLEQEYRDLMTGFRAHYAEKNPKQLETEQFRYFAKLRNGERLDQGMPLDVLLTFPGFADFKRGPVS